MINRIADLMKIWCCWNKGIGYKPIRVEMMISSRCNSLCVMCNVWKLIRSNPDLQQEELSLEDVKFLFEDLKEMGTRNIVLSGGEPTLREDIITIIKEAKKQKFQVEMITNGH